MTLKAVKHQNAIGEMKHLKTQLQFMYGRNFYDSKKYTWQTCHGYEQEIGDIQVLFIDFY